MVQVTTLEEVVSNMNEDLIRTLDLVAPTKEVKAKKRRPKQWYDEELKQQRKILKNREPNGSNTGRIVIGMHLSAKETDTSTC